MAARQRVKEIKKQQTRPIGHRGTSSVVQHRPLYCRTKSGGKQRRSRARSPRGETRGVGERSRSLGRILAPATRLLPPRGRRYPSGGCALEGGVQALQLLQVGQNVRPSRPQFIFCMGIQRTGAGLVPHRSGRFPKRRPQKPLFALRLDQPLPADAALMGVVVEIAFQRRKSALGSNRGRGTGRDASVVACRDFFNPVSIATQAQNHTAGLASLVATHPVRSSSREELAAVQDNAGPPTAFPARGGREGS